METSEITYIIIIIIVSECWRKWDFAYPVYPLLSVSSLIVSKSEYVFGVVSHAFWVRLYHATLA